MKRRVPLSRIWSLSLTATALVLLAATWYAGSDPGVAGQAQALADARILAEQMKSAAVALARDLATGKTDQIPIAELRFGEDRELLQPRPLPVGQILQDQLAEESQVGPTPAASWLAEANRLWFEQDWPAAFAAVENGEREIADGEEATLVELLLKKAELKIQLGEPEQAASILESVRSFTFPSDLLDGPLHLILGYRIAAAWIVAKRPDRAESTYRQMYRDLMDGKMAMSPQRLHFVASDLQNLLNINGETNRVERAVDDFQLAEEVRQEIKAQPQASSLLIRGRVIFFDGELNRGLMYPWQTAYRLARLRLEEMLPASQAFEIASGGAIANGSVAATLDLTQGFGQKWRLVLAKPEAYTRPATLRLTLLYSGTLLIIFALAIVGIWGARALRRRAELENLRRDFVAGVSHELRTPAASICLLAGNLMDGRVANEDRRQQYYQALNRDAQRLQRLVADVLDASRLERGVFQVDPRFMNPGPLLRDLAEEQAPRLADAGLQLKTEIADELPDTMLDAPSVERAVANLLENARKYAHEGGLVILRAWSDEKGLIIEIEDRGSGVPENLREKIFEAYERGLAGRNNRHPAEGSVGLAAGAGLGLALVRETLIAHGGTAEVLDARNTESSDGSKEESELSLTTGARFRLSFPVCSEE